MKAEIKNFEFKIEDADSKGIIQGFASTFGNIDLGDDVVDQGAFKKTIKETSGGKIPILADHNPTTPIGWNMQAEETDGGLKIMGKINMEDPFARARYALAKQAMDIGAPMGLSIGYGVVKSEPDKERPRVRRLKELKLYEYSIVVFPMNPKAIVTAAKMFESIEDKQEFMRAILNQAKTLGLSLNDILASLHTEAERETLDVDPLLIKQSAEGNLSAYDRIINSLKI